MNERKNYWKLGRLSLRYYYYAFVDVPENLADQLFISHKVRVYFGDEFEKEDLQYKIILCKIRKSDETEFLAALSEMYNKMYLMGYSDYEENCARIDDMFSRGLKERKK